MTVYVFPGQGSQSKGMGEALFAEFPALTQQADHVLGYSIRRLCVEDPEQQLGLTQYTQPALFTVNALYYLKMIKDTGKKPDFVAGHSLGEYNALFAADVFDFATGLALVQRRGELMSRCSGGGMAAVIGLTEAELADALAAHDLDGLDIANCNSSTQIVLSGPAGELERARTTLEALPKVQMFVPLKTSGAFHSRYMRDVQHEYARFLNGVELRPPALPVISNVRARPYDSDIRRLLINQLAMPVRWTDSVRYLLAQGETQFKELGPGNVLTGLIRRIVRETAPPVPADGAGNPAAASPAVAPNAPAGEAAGPGAENSAPAAGAPADFAGTAASAAGVPSPLPGDEASRRAEPFRPAAESARTLRITAAALGSASFKRDYGLRYAYLTGGMYRGVASKELVVRVGRAGMLGFLGCGGLKPAEIEDALAYIRRELRPGDAYGCNLVHNLHDPRREEAQAELFIRWGVPVIEASAFLGVTPALALYRAKGLRREPDGGITRRHKIIAKLSRPEVAESFLSPTPERVIAALLADGRLTPQEAELLRLVPVADDLTVEADSAGHTDGATAYALFPAILRLRDRLVARHGYGQEIRVGAAGGIGAPEAAAAAFTMGADFILTGSINQCTVEAGTSEAVKRLLEQMNVQDTEYAPAGDMFELGAKVQVLKKGVFFPARANKLLELYRRHESLDDIDAKQRSQLEDKYFKRSLEAVYEEVKAHYPPQELEKAERQPKLKMAMVFKWYFHYSNQLALAGSEESRVDYQIHCGPALGAFNQWVQGTPLESWTNRHVDEIGLKLMNGTAELLAERLQFLLAASAAEPAYV